jgi:hypothetical protein
VVRLRRQMCPINVQERCPKAGRPPLRPPRAAVRHLVLRALHGRHRGLRLLTSGSSGTGMAMWGPGVGRRKRSRRKRGGRESSREMGRRVFRALQILRYAGREIYMWSMPLKVDVVSTLSSGSDTAPHQLFALPRAQPSNLHLRTSPLRRCTT